MVIRSRDLDIFAVEVRRLRRQAEPTLYPAYKALVRRSYGSAGQPIYVDTNRHTAGTGFPDLTISCGALCLNWFEIKSPTVSVDPLPSADQARFDNYRRTLPHVVLTNGWTWRLFNEGEEVERVDLPRGWLLQQLTLSSDQQEKLINFLERCTTLSPQAAANVEEAVHLLAVAARMICQTVQVVPVAEYPNPLRAARDSFTRLLRLSPADDIEIGAHDFADALAQTAVFGYLLARIEADTDVTPIDAPSELSSTEHPFLINTLHGLLVPDPGMENLLKGVLRAACDMVNRAAPRLADEQGGWSQVADLYEDFFTAYRPSDRFRYGVFYTPPTIAKYQVREISRVLREEFGLDGVTDPAVRFLDPACGTGTYLLALAQVCADEAADPSRGMPVGTALYSLFSDRVAGFEISPGTASVAQTRLVAWLRSKHVFLGERFPVFTVNTLTPPQSELTGHTGNPWADNIRAEQLAGDQVKADKPVLVVLGNPPWGRRDRDVFTLDGQRNPLTTWAQGASGAAQSVYDLYVAFWRFACEMLLERPSVQLPRGIVSYITNRTWLRGRPFTGMRGYMRDHAAVVWVTDLGGNVRTSEIDDDEGVFDIKAGSAIATVAFGGGTEGPAVHFRRILGSRQQKLDHLRDEVPVWTSGPQGRIDPMALADWKTLDAAPSVPSYFRKDYPGVKTHRDNLVVDVDREQLISRLITWNGIRDSDERSDIFHDSASRVAPDRSYVVNEAYVQMYRYRPLDDRWLYGDRRFIDRPGTITRIYDERPGSHCLLTLDSGTVNGPVVIATDRLPDYHSIRGSYGSHVLPIDVTNEDLFADPVDTLSEWASQWATYMLVTSHAVARYLLALGNAPSYIEFFGETVSVEPPRLPATTDADVFQDSATVGGRLLDAWCLRAGAIGQWRQLARTGTPMGQAEIVGSEVHFRNGDKLVGLHPETAQLEVSGYRVMARFLKARAQLPLTTELAQQVRTVAASIKVILDERKACDKLLERALTAPTWTAERGVPFPRRPDRADVAVQRAQDEAAAKPTADPGPSS